MILKRGTLTIFRADPDGATSQVVVPAILIRRDGNRNGYLLPMVATYCACHLN